MTALNKRAIRWMNSLMAMLWSCFQLKDLGSLFGLFVRFARAPRLALSSFRQTSTMIRDDLNALRSLSAPDKTRKSPETQSKKSPKAPAKRGKQSALLCCVTSCRTLLPSGKREKKKTAARLSGATAALAQPFPPSPLNSHPPHPHRAKWR